MEYFDLTKKNVCHIKHGSKNGSGFLISNNEIITAKHCIDSSLNGGIKVKFLELEGGKKILNAEILDDSDDKIIILKIDTQLKFEHFKVAKMKLRKYFECETFGYPEVMKSTGTGIKLEIDDVKTSLNFEEANYNIILKYDPACRIENFYGLSGSPLIVDKTVVGVIIFQADSNDKAHHIKAVGFSKCEKYLLNNGVRLPSQKKKIGKKSEKSNIKIEKNNITKIKNTTNFKKNNFKDSVINFGTINNKK
jgi:V8-like Glu-specific endopeptidase